jgi:hypothetical protein
MNLLLGELAVDSYFISFNGSGFSSFLRALEIVLFSCPPVIKSDEIAVVIFIPQLVFLS